MSANALEVAGEVQGKPGVESGTEQSGATSNEAQPLPIAFTVSKATRWVFAFVVTMVVTGIAANLVSNYVAPSPEHKLAKLMNRFDLTTEMSIPNWYSSIALLVAAVLLGVIARSTYVRRERFFRHWLALSLIFVFLSIDEACRMHEGINTAASWFVHGHGLLYNPWVIPYGIFAAAVGLSYIPLLIHLGRRTAILFLTAGDVYVGGALCMDAVGSALDEHYGRANIQSHVSDYIEETMEDTGELLFIYGLLDYIRRSIGRVVISVS